MRDLPQNAQQWQQWPHSAFTSEEILVMAQQSWYHPTMADWDREALPIWERTSKTSDAWRERAGLSCKRWGIVRPFSVDFPTI